jgi:hypothetical protein
MEIYNICFMYMCVCIFVHTYTQCDTVYSLNCAMSLLYCQDNVTLSFTADVSLFCVQPTQHTALLLLFALPLLHIFLSTADRVKGHT